MPWTMAPRGRHRIEHIASRAGRHAPVASRWVYSPPRAGPLSTQAMRFSQGAVLPAPLSPWLPAQSAAPAPGFRLFGPINSTVTWLVDTTGAIVHTWPSTFLPGLGVYMLEDGSLLRAIAS